MLQTANLTKRFNGQAAVDNLTLKIAAGEIFALLGPNGAGKTTTINLLLGFLTPDGGEARVEDERVRAVHELEYAAEEGRGDAETQEP